MPDAVVTSTSRSAADPEWDAFVAGAPGGHHLQSSAWGRVKATVGLRAVRVRAERNGAVVGGCQVLVRDLPVVGAVGYAPRGPLAVDADAREAVVAGLEHLAREERIAYLKVQPPAGAEGLAALLRARGLRESTLQTAPVATTRVPVAGRDDDDLLGAMRAMTRRNVRVAARRGVSVREGTAADVEILHRLLVATGRRQGFAVYGPDYLRTMWHAFAPGGGARLLVAEHDDVAVSAAMLIAFGDSVVYKIGAWGGTHRELRANEAVHWAGIRGARDAGRAYYDFDGIVPAVAEALDEGHKPAPEAVDGVTAFKLGFGGEIAMFPGTLDAAHRGAIGWALRAVAPHAQRWRRVAHALAGRGR